MTMPHSNSSDPDDWVMTESQLRAVIDRWSPRVRELAFKIVRMSYRQDPDGRWGYIHALDRLRNNLSAIAALHVVVDEWDLRPRYHEVLKVADAVIEIRWDLRKLVDDHPNRRRYGPTPRFGFVRRS
jgi:hypothetical protein